MNNVYCVGTVNHRRSVHDEIDTIVGAAFSNMLKSADLNIKENQPTKQADERSSNPSADERNSDRSRETGQQLNLNRGEKRDLANVDVAEQHKMEMRLKGDAGNDETSRKQWGEQRTRMDLGKRPFRETAEEFPREIDDADKIFHGTLSVRDTGFVRETSDGELSAKSENPPASFEKETVGSSDEHGVSPNHAEETDIPAAPVVQITGDSDAVDRENFQNIGNEQLLETEHTDNIVPSDVAASGVESDKKGEAHTDKNDDREAEAMHELAEGLHKSPADHHDDEIQTAAATDVLDDATTADDTEHQVSITEDDQTVVEHDIVADSDPTLENEEDADSGSESDFVSKELPRGTDEGTSELPPALDNGGNKGWIFSALSNIFYVIDAIINVVSHEPILPCDAMLAWNMLSSCVHLCPPVCSSVHLSQVGVLPRWLNLGACK